jgi:hypothetical protein
VPSRAVVESAGDQARAGMRDDGIRRSRGGSMDGEAIVGWRIGKYRTEYVTLV